MFAFHVFFNISMLARFEPKKLEHRVIFSERFNLIQECVDEKH
jgi:hypothetical protein